jgi:hypothetical protein
MASLAAVHNLLVLLYCWVAIVDEDEEGATAPTGRSGPNPTQK